MSRRFQSRRQRAGPEPESTLCEELDELLADEPEVVPVNPFISAIAKGDLEEMERLIAQSDPELWNTPAQGIASPLVITPLSIPLE